MPEANESVDTEGGLADPPEFTVPQPDTSAVDPADDADDGAAPDPGIPFEVGTEGDQGEWHPEAVEAASDTDDTQEDTHV